MKLKMYRQGDVLLVRVNDIPEGLKDIPLNGDRIVLAYGEVTGHAHAISPEKLATFVINEQTQNRYLELHGAEFLRHEEHEEIKLPAGKYRVIQQTEYTPKEWRTVAD